jgi:hypothetical protein
MEASRGFKPALRWVSKDPSITVSDDDYVATKTTADPGTYPAYRSVISDRPLQLGLSYQISLKLSSLNDFKVGVCSSNSQDHCGKAFSDTPEGWALLTDARELRHESNKDGARYLFEATPDRLIMFLDTREGTLSFGTEFLNFGVAYRCEEFKTQQMYVAVAMKSMKSSCELLYRLPLCWERRLYTLWGVSRGVDLGPISRLSPHLAREAIQFI